MAWFSLDISKLGKRERHYLEIGGLILGAGAIYAVAKLSAGSSGGVGPTVVQQLPGLDDLDDEATNGGTVSQGGWGSWGSWLNNLVSTGSSGSDDAGTGGTTSQTGTGTTGGSGGGSSVVTPPPVTPPPAGGSQTTVPAAYSYPSVSGAGPGEMGLIGGSINQALEGVNLSAPYAPTPFSGNTPATQQSGGGGSGSGVIHQTGSQTSFHG